MNQVDKVYITASNLTKLKSFYIEAVSITNELVKSELYKDDLSWIMSGPQMKSLFIEGLILSNDERMKVAERPVAKSITSKMLFLNSSPPKYHEDYDCKFMRASYQNFLIPIEIEVRGEKAIENFRKFAQENKKIFYENQDRFLVMVEAAFGLQTPLKKVDYANSGVEEFSDLAVDQMEEAIHKHLVAANEFKSQSPEVEKEIKKYNYAPSTVVEAGNVSDIVKKWHNFYQAELRKMLRSYIIKSRNPQLSFERSFLNGLGFKVCNACRGPAF